MYGGQYRQPKRAHSPDFEDNNYRGPHRGPGGFQTHHFQKRQRNENFDQPRTLEEKISKLGDTGSRPVEIGLLVKEINAELGNKVTKEEKIREITAHICKCIISFPTRVSTYATLIALISVHHCNVSCQVINTLHASYPVYLEAQKWQEAIIIIHLLSNFVNCKVIRPETILSQFELLLEVATEENVPQARSDYFVYTVMSSLPYVALAFSAESRLESSFEKILSTIEDYLAGRSKSHLNETRVWLSSDSTTQMDYLDSLWVQMKNFKANTYNETFLYRPYNEKEYKDLLESDKITQNSPTIQIPAHSSEYVYPEPRIIFRIYDDDVLEMHRSIPGSDKIERFCIENHIRNIIDELHSNPWECARHLSRMNHWDHLPLKHILIETLLGEMFALPQPKHPQMLYISLIREFTKIFQPSENAEELKYNYNVILNEGVRVLFDNMDTMNVTCIDRFIEWFSFHLNNIGFIFPWQTWSDATTKSNDSPKAVFVQGMLDRCIRLSFHNKMSTLISGHLDSLLPPEPSVSYKPVFPDHPKTPELAALVEKLIVDKAQGPAICEALNIVIENVVLPEEFVLKEESLDDKLVKLDNFTAVILSKASKSLTHLSMAIGKYKNVFTALTKFEGGQLQLLKTMHSCLELHPQLQVILVEKLVKAQLIETKEVIDWIFSDQLRPHHLKSYPWELLNNTTFQCYQSMRKLEDDQKNLMESASKKQASTDGDVEMSTDTLDIKPAIDNNLGPAIEDARKRYYTCMLHTFQLFADITSDHIKYCEANGVSYLDTWFRWITGRMQQLFYNHYTPLLSKYSQIVNILEGTPSISSSIMNLSQ